MLGETGLQLTPLPAPIRHSGHCTQQLGTIVSTKTKQVIKDFDDRDKLGPETLQQEL